MRLVRFLAAGKSLVGLRDTEGRYRLPNGRALPRFGAVKDGGVSAGAESARQQIQAESEATSASADAGAVAVHRQVEMDAGLGKRPQSALRLESDRSESQSIFRKLFGWLPWFREAPAVGGIPAFSRVPVQTELSLENVKVIRNDLSETDLEFQSAGNQPVLNPFSKPQAGEPVEAVATPPNLPGTAGVAGSN